jgi:hypothetical protein
MGRRQPRGQDAVGPALRAGGWPTAIENNSKQYGRCGIEALFASSGFQLKSRGVHPAYAVPFTPLIGCLDVSQILDATTFDGNGCAIRKKNLEHHSPWRFSNLVLTFIKVVSLADH